MAAKCAWCGSADTEALLDRRRCLVCGGYTNYKDEAVQGGANQETIDAHVRTTHAP